MEIKYNDTFSTSHSSDGVFDFIEKDTTILKGSRNESTSLPKSTEVNSNETLSSGYKPQSVQLDKPESSLVKGTVVEVKPILLSDPDVNTKAAFAKSHTRDFYKGRSFRYAGKWEEGVHYINDEYITDFVVKDGVLLVCKKSNMSSWSNEPTEWVYDGDQIISIISDYWEVVLVGGVRGKTYLPEYDEDSDSLVWRLVDPTDLPEEFQTYLGIKDYIDYALVPIQEDLADINSDIDITKRDVKVLEGNVISLGNDLTNLEIITGRISTHVENLEGDFSDFVQTAEGFFYKVGNLENNVGQLWLTSQQFGVQLENAEGDISRLTIQADQISTRVENAEGNISQINQRADEISTQVENQQGDISRISQRADQIQSEVENQQGDISRITQRADLIESQVSNLDGDVSVISQTANEIQSQVTNIEGDISAISQRADEITSRVENVEGDVSTISQRADEIELRVSNDEGDISQIRQTSNEISLKVSDVEGDVAQLDVKADEISSTVENQQGEISSIIQRADMIESEVRANKADADGQFVEVNSRITQTAEEIQSEVVANKIDADGKIENANSRITQQAGLIATKVSQTEYDLKTGEIESNVSAIDQKADNINLSVQQVSARVDQNARTFTEAINDLQEQLDGAIDTWFYNYAPVQTDATGAPTSTTPLITRTVSGQQVPVLPYYDWYTEDQAATEDHEKVRNEHVSDIFYDTKSGYAYRFIGTGAAGSRVYTWVAIEDSAVIKALQDAKNAQDTADNKRRVFVANPTVPYDLGDLWVKSTTVGNVSATELYRCIVAKTSAQSADLTNDWAVADSYAKEVSKSNVQILADAIVQQALTYTYDEYGRLTKDTKSAITTGMNDISLAITGSKLETVGIFIRNADVNDNYINLISDKVKIKGPGDHTPTGLSIDWDPTSSSYKISAANLHVEGAFETSAWTDATTGQRKLVLDDAATAATGPTGYLTEALYGSGGSAASPTGGVYGTINPMTTALSNFTTITGGLILSTELILGQQSGQTWVPWAGMSGVYDNSSGSENWGHGIAAWYGGDCVDKARLTDAQIAQGWAIHRWARSLFRMDGSGYLADNNIWWGASGELHIGANTIIGNSGSVTFSQLASTVAELASYFEVVEVPSGASYVPYLKLKGSGTGFKGFVVDGFISAGGISSGGGTSGIDWGALEANTTEKINTSHLPTLSYSGGVTAQYGSTGSGSTLSTTLDISIAANTFAAYSHTHTTSIATSTGTNQITLAFGSKYALTAGGTSYIFTMPSYSAATSQALGLVKSSTTGTTANRDYNVQVNSDGTMKVNVPWSNTTYSFSNADATLAWSTRTKIATTGGTDIYVTMPANPNTDANVTQTATTTNSAYEILFSGTADNTTRTEGTRKASTLTYNPSTKALVTGGTVDGLTLGKQTTGFTISGGTTSKTLTVGANYTLGAACAKGVTDNTSAANVTSSDTNLITGRTLYYQLAKRTINSKALSADITLSLDDVADGSTRKLANYVLKAGDSMTGALTFSQTSSTRRNGIIGTYDANRAAAIWTMGSSYQIAADGLTMGNLYGACYAYYGSGYTYGAGKSGGHSFVWAQNGSPTVALGNNVWTSGGFIKNGGTASQFLKADGSVDSNTYLTTTSAASTYLPLTGGTITLSDYNGLKIQTTHTSGYSMVRYYGKVNSALTTLGWLGFSGVDDASVWDSAGRPYSIYHSGNSNSTSVPWSASSLTLNGAISGATTISASDTLRVCPSAAESTIAKLVTYPANPFGLIISTLSSGCVKIQSQREANNSETFALSLNPAGGDVGIGTSSPSYPLDVYGSARCNYMRFRNSAGTGNSGYIGRAASSADSMYIWNNANATMYFGTNNTTRMIINSSGNVTIGASDLASTSNKLYVNGASGWTSIFDSTSTKIWLSHGSGHGMFISSKSNSASYNLLDLIYNDSSLNGGGTIAMVVRADGAVGIGTSSPAYTLDVNGTIGIRSSSLQTFNINRTGVGLATMGIDGNGLYISHTPNGGSLGHMYFIGGSNPALNVTGSVIATGAITAGSASDARLKTNINTLSDEQAKSLIMALRPVTFTWNQKATELYDQYKGNDLGFVAQEVENVQNIVPGMSKAIGTIFENYKRLDPVKFIAPIVKVEQDHERRIHELEKAVKARDEKIEELEKRLNRI